MPNLRQRAGKSHIGYRTDIQGIRALAVTFVVAYHAGAEKVFSSGFIGVDIFFVISGWVITNSVISRQDRTGRFDFRAFWLRRFRRLAPALGVVAAITGGLSLLFLAPEAAEQSIWTAIGSVFSLGNVAAFHFTKDYFSLSGDLNSMLHSWSLGVEEQFYLGFSVIALLVSRAITTEKARALTVALLILFLISLSLAFLGYADVIDGWISTALLGFYSPLPRIWEFCLGALAYLFSRQFGYLVGLRGSLAYGLGLLLLVLSPFGLLPGGAPPTSWSVMLAAVGAMMVLLSGPGQLGKQILSHPVLIWIGDRSYSIYLWHWPLIVISAQVFVGFPWAEMIGAVVSIPVAALSYLKIEKRFVANQ